MTIIKQEKVNGLHPVQKQSGRTKNWMGPGWVEVPEHLVSTAFSSGGYCELVLEHGALTNLVITQQPPQPEPTAEEDTDAMLVDHEYRLTLLELGLVAE